MTTQAKLESKQSDLPQWLPCQFRVSGSYTCLFPLLSWEPPKNCILKKLLAQLPFCCKSSVPPLLPGMLRLPSDAHHIEVDPFQISDFKAALLFFMHDLVSLFKGCRIKYHAIFGTYTEKIVVLICNSDLTEWAVFLFTKSGNPTLFPKGSIHFRTPSPLPSTL